MASPTGIKLVTSALVLAAATAQSERDIAAIPSDGNFILHEQSLDMNRTATVSVQSDVPVTVHRYSDSVSCHPAVLYAILSYYRTR